MRVWTLFLNCLPYGVLHHRFLDASNDCRLSSTIDEQFHESQIVAQVTCDRENSSSHVLEPLHPCAESMKDYLRDASP